MRAASKRAIASADCRFLQIMCCQNDIMKAVHFDSEGLKKPTVSIMKKYKLKLLLAIKIKFSHVLFYL